MEPKFDAKHYATGLKAKAEPLVSGAQELGADRRVACTEHRVEWSAHCISV